MAITEATLGRRPATRETTAGRGGNGLIPGGSDGPSVLGEVTALGRLDLTSALVRETRATPSGDFTNCPCGPANPVLEPTRVASLRTSDRLSPAVSAAECSINNCYNLVPNALNRL